MPRGYWFFSNFDPSAVIFQFSPIKINVNMEKRELEPISISFEGGKREKRSGFCRVGNYRFMPFPPRIFCPSRAFDVFIFRRLAVFVFRRLAVFVIRRFAVSASQPFRRLAISALRTPSSFAFCFLLLSDFQAR